MTRAWPLAFEEKNSHNTKSSKTSKVFINRKSIEYMLIGTKADTEGEFLSLCPHGRLNYFYEAFFWVSFGPIILICWLTVYIGISQDPLMCVHTSLNQVSSVQSLSRVWLFANPWITARQASLSITNSRSPPKPISIDSDAIKPSYPLSTLLFLPPIPPSIRVFTNESTLHMRWSKNCSFSFSTSPSNDHPWLVSFRMDWLDLLTVQGTLKSLLQHHRSKPSILQCSALFIVQI